MSLGLIGVVGAVVAEVVADVAAGPELDVTASLVSLPHAASNASAARTVMARCMHALSQTLECRPDHLVNRVRGLWSLDPPGGISQSLTMRLQISRRADLAVRAAALLSVADGSRNATVLADLLATTPGFLTQAIGPLVKAGLVRSTPGPTGGYALVVDPSALSVLDVIEAVEGPTEHGRCVVADTPCTATSPCAMHHAWSGARDSLLESLRNTSIRAFQGAFA